MESGIDKKAVMTYIFTLNNVISSHLKILLLNNYKEFQKRFFYSYF